MYILLTDESNKEASDNARFFIYGGLCVPVSEIGRIHMGIERIRAKARYGAEAALKFDTNKRPQGITQEVVTQAKKEVMELCFYRGCRFLAVCTLHELARNRSLEERLRWSANTLLGAFNSFLHEDKDAHGIVMVDRLPIKNPDSHLVDLFARGLEFRGGKRLRLDRVAACCTLPQGASHLCAAIDISLGTFRYCVNSTEDSEKVREMWKSVARMLWYREVNGMRRIRERGLLIRPKEVKVEEHQEQYDALIEKLEGLLSRA